MTADEVLARVQAMLEDDFAITRAVDRDTHLRVDLGLDSLALTDLAFLVKQDFALADIGPDAFRGVTTVGLLVDMIVQHG